MTTDYFVSAIPISSTHSLYYFVAPRDIIPVRQCPWGNAHEPMNTTQFSHDSPFFPKIPHISNGLYACLKYLHDPAFIAVNHCLFDDYFLPSIHELAILSKAFGDFNDGAPLWSCTEYDRDCAYAVDGDAVVPFAKSDHLEVRAFRKVIANHYHWGAQF